MPNIYATFDDALYRDFESRPKSPLSLDFPQTRIQKLRNLRQIAKNYPGSAAYYTWKDLKDYQHGKIARIDFSPVVMLLHQVGLGHYIYNRITNAEELSLFY